MVVDRLKGRMVRIIRQATWAAGLNPFPIEGGNPGTAGAQDRSTAFDNIYTSNAWDSTESRSGPGSEVARTRRYAQALRDYLSRHQVESVFDAPCGDLNWILPVVRGVRYVGGDVSASLIADLHRRYPEVDTRVFDICGDTFPAVNVWHCRDCLFHLSFDDIRLALQTFVSSRVPVALLTTHRALGLHTNVDIPLGGWRILDMQRPPISLPRPIEYLRDYRWGRDFPRYVGAWRSEQVAAALKAWE